MSRSSLTIYLAVQLLCISVAECLNILPSASFSEGLVLQAVGEEAIVAAELAGTNMKTTRTRCSLLIVLMRSVKSKKSQKKYPTLLWLL